MLDWSRVKVIGKISLVKEVVPGGAVIIGSKTQIACITNRRTGIYVLVKFVICGIVGTVPEGKSRIKFVFNQRIERRDSSICVAEPRVAEEC